MKVVVTRPAAISVVSCYRLSQSGGTLHERSISPARSTDATPTAFDDTSEDFNDLPPGIYTCTVNVDP